MFSKVFLLLACSAILSLVSCKLSSSHPMEISHINDSLTRIEIRQPLRYLLLPIQEDQPEVKVRLLGDTPEDTWLDIRLAVDSVDYYVPFPLSREKGCTLEILHLKKSAVAWEKLILSDTFDTSKRDYYRPAYHYTPDYGWMNDPNGLIYHEGVYHLYYQFNPFGSKWGNMCWGHATTRDFIHWTHETPALRRDTLGHIFSGSTILDREGIAGFGQGAILAYYTAHRMHEGKQWQAQCLAYSTDGGYTYTKYKGNPILTSSDGVVDFRDPKVFWYAPTKQWYMIVSADKEMRFFRSQDLKSWEYVSAFGEGYGARPNQFECPDFFELPMEGTNEKKWVMLVNINPGCPFGGSATEYFVGSFDGQVFTPDTDAEIARWLDFGKDHYAFVTFHNVKGRTLGLPWVSNWQYANVTPFRQSRGMNGLPRELFLFSQHGRSYVGARPAREVTALRKSTQTLSLPPRLTDSVMLSSAFQSYEDSFELELTLAPARGVQRVGIVLSNASGDRLPIYLDLNKRRVVMDRTESGLTDFGQLSTPHERESMDWRTGEGINYKNDFALATWAPLELCAGPTYKLRLFFDRSVAELFVDEGRIAMTNLVFPRRPYTALSVFSEGATTEIKDARLHRLGR